MKTTPDNPHSCNEDGCSAREELDWLAFRYVANEMTGSEVLDFEGRLSDDLAAQAAVARAVEMTHAIVSVIDPVTAPETTPAKRAFVGRRKLWWAVAATSAAAVAVCAAFFAGQQTGGQRPDGMANNEDSKESNKDAGAIGKESQTVPRLTLSETTAATVVDAWANSGEDLQDDEPRAIQSLKIAKADNEDETVQEGEFDWVVSGLNGTVTLMDNGNE